MKLDDKQKQASLKEHTYNLDWAKEIAEKYKADIPVIQDIPKGMGSVSLHIRIPAFLGDLTERIACAKEIDLKSTSEVGRAAMYIGVNLLYNIIETQGGKNPNLESFYKVIKISEELISNHVLIKNALTVAGNFKEVADFGMISFEDRDLQLADLIKSLPHSLQPILKKKIKQLLAGDKISELSELKSYGGKRE